jgi:hypothetical protein
MSLFDHLGDLPIMAMYAPRLRASPELAPFLIHNPVAIPALVQALGGETDPAALERMAGDPNASVEALSYLAGCFPAAFCANPIFPLLLFERHALPAEMEPTSLGRLLAYPDLPAEFAGAVAAYGQPDLAAAARQHIALVGEAGAGWRAELPGALDEITALPDDDLMTALAALGLVPVWLHDRVARGARPALLRALGREAPADETPASSSARAKAPRAQGAADPARPPAELMALADDEDDEVRAALATNPALGPAELLDLKRCEDWADNDPLVYEALAANPRAPAELLREIAANRTALNTAARREVARNPATPPDVLSLLADELYAADIRVILIGHPNLGPEQRAAMVSSSLEAAVGSGSPIYRAIALSHPDVSPEAAERALRSPHWVERLAMALSPTTGAEALARLASDGNRLVRAAAKGMLSVEC